jgi:hypothetical protein
VPRKQTRAEVIVETAIDSIEEAATSVGSKVSHAATAIANSSLVDRAEKQAKTSRKAIAKNVAKAKKVAKKQVAKATKRVAATKKVAKKQIAKTTKKAAKKAPTRG